MILIFISFSCQAQIIAQLVCSSDQFPNHSCNRGHSHVAYRWSSFYHRKIKKLRHTIKIRSIWLIFLIQWYIAQFLILMWCIKSSCTKLVELSLIQVHRSDLMNLCLPTWAPLPFWLLQFQDPRICFAQVKDDLFISIFQWAYKQIEKVVHHFHSTILLDVTVLAQCCCISIQFIESWRECVSLHGL